MNAVVVVVVVVVAVAVVVAVLVAVAVVHKAVGVTVIFNGDPQPCFRMTT